MNEGNNPCACIKSAYINGEDVTHKYKPDDLANMNSEKCFGCEAYEATIATLTTRLEEAERVMETYHDTHIFKADKAYHAYHAKWDGEK